MGYGAYMQFTNTTDADVFLTLGDVRCMYDNGDEGSNLQVFNNVTVPPKGTVGPQYIEAKASGSCAFESSNFRVEVSGPAGGAFTITESMDEYSSESGPPDRLLVEIDNGDPDAQIRASLFP